ncbi:fatty acid oxidation complex subunit alpha FadB [Venatoribacter cucullus]|uniref:fatty acid oxidation complex subunit alpha FadB n=1 Tax=Venatoribacter cucullus TaxID=2661630 RepID=UPI001936CB83|nr:fatty acid oxidation complex subunit alpha FadB [Venatoribacter cucullus]QQD21858.1 fatty acid oxidation complex subunit alpha FadB [Oceanospirillaceae bacterium ASx5O]UZK03274.1 fatty acid oxidation complex subunit alpha FadB [Venatoribacter cucullus]
MIYEGKAITVNMIEGGIAELKFDLQGDSVNKFNRVTLEDLQAAVAAVQGNSDVKGVLVTSGKDVFIVGADITEFGDAFKKSEEEIAAWVAQANVIFNAFEDLPVPTLTAINGIALGGGFEMCLASDLRVMSDKAKVGLPEVKLGLMPGFGGTVRLPRVIGADNAIEWICMGAENRADKALKDGAVDAVVAADKLREAAVAMLQSAIAGELNWQARREEKKAKLKLNAMESMMVFETAKGFVAGQTKGQYPAPIEAIKTMQKAAGQGRDKALEAEAKGFAKLAKTTESQALIGLFMNDQLLKKKAKVYGKTAKPTKKAAVLGAGIMGGGIAYQSALKGTPIMMKDIAEAGIELGLSEANKLLAKRVEKKRMKPLEMGDVLNRIRPTLSYAEFNDVDTVVEAVVENPKVKKMVLAELEDKVREDTIITSNTSTISIDLLAADLKRPENFLGMHFFNPVHMMPLVEIIRGKKTSEEAVATVVAYATAMGKTPIVVNDCPGFLVNRVLFPYFAGFAGLLRDGADFQAVDKVMEKFGFPMGPAYLLDVVGIDTGVHANEVMAEGFPDRMKADFKSAMEVMYENKRYGQKNGVGFYKYETDKKGKPKKVVDQAAYDLIAPVVAERKEYDAEEIIARCMIPMCIEIARCLEEGIVDTPNEADMGLIFGIGFPPFRGGACRYMDTVGMANFVALCDKYADLGNLYKPTDRMREMAANGESYFG